MSYIFDFKWGQPGSRLGQLANPFGIALDASQDLYVAEINNNRVQKFDKDGGAIGILGGPGSGNGLFNHPHDFSFPSDVAVDSGGNVFVADAANNRIIKFGGSGTFIRSWGGLGTSDGQFKFPLGVATDSSGNVFVADKDNNRVQKFSNIGVFIKKWGSAGTGNGEFQSPWGITVDSSGNVFVADRVGDRIEEFTNSGGFVRTWGSSGTSSLSTSTPNTIVQTENSDIQLDPFSNNPADIQ